MHDSTVPADLLELQSKLNSWRRTRKYLREPIPDEIRHAAAEMSRRYSPSLVRRHLKLDPWKLNKMIPQKSPRAPKAPLPTPFFALPPEAAIAVASPSPRPSDCRLQIERPDGSRLTFVLSAFDASTITTLCAQFLRS